jgi:hypothetical protein
VYRSIATRPPGSVCYDKESACIKTESLMT